VEIKWPNDILLDKRKAGGMLIENSVRGAWLSDCIVGVGINLNQDMFEGFETPAISLKMVTGLSYDAGKEALELASHLDWSLAAIQSDSRLAIGSAYDNCLFGLNNELCFDHAGERIAAVLRGVDENGLAVLESPLGRISVSHPDYRLSPPSAPKA
jgi:BirA family biotin operon repressor/biotin-[acetyl-CoA-carboxylase] ligase